MKKWSCLLLILSCLTAFCACAERAEKYGRSDFDRAPVPTEEKRDPEAEIVGVLRYDPETDAINYEGDEIDLGRACVTDIVLSDVEDEDVRVRFAAEALWILVKEDEANASYVGRELTEIRITLTDSEIRMAALFDGYIGTETYDPAVTFTGGITNVFYGLYAYSEDKYLELVHKDAVSVWEVSPDKVREKLRELHPAIDFEKPEEEQKNGELDALMSGEFADSIAAELPAGTYAEYISGGLLATLCGADDPFWKNSFAAILRSDVLRSSDDFTQFLWYEPDRCFGDCVVGAKDDCVIGVFDTGVVTLTVRFSFTDLKGSWREGPREAPVTVMEREEPDIYRQVTSDELTAVYYELLGISH